MNDGVIPLNKIGKIETVKVYNQSYVNKQQKRITELEKKISNLLSCKNCLENKGGLLCQKEYEDKCLSQKIQYIKELKEENTELKLKLEALEGQTPWKDIKDKSELIKKNAELKSECRTCIYTDTPCVLSDYEKSDNGVCSHYKNVFEENEELKKDKEDLIFVRDQRAKCMCEDKERLSKAKELIRQLCLMVRELNNPNVQLTNVDYSLAEAEQFLKENR